MDMETEPAGAGPRRRTVIAFVLVVLGVALLGLGGIVVVAVGGSPTAPDAPSRAVGASTDGYTVWERNDDGHPVRWDACSPVEIVLAMQGAPEGARQDLAEAVATLRRATGLDLTVTGTTSERPRDGRLPYQPEQYGQRWAPVLVAWASPGDADLPLGDADRGVAIPIAVGAPGARVYVTGQVVLNADRDDLRPGSADRSDSWGATILHELGHVLGLGHVDNPDELMATHPGDGPVRLGPGDLAGLRAVGAETACLEVPTPQPVNVAEPAQR